MQFKLKQDLMFGNMLVKSGSILKTTSHDVDKHLEFYSEVYKILFDLRAFVDKWQYTYIDFGASDSEPNYLIPSYINNGLELIANNKFGSFKLPARNPFDLYSSMEYENPTEELRKRIVKDLKDINDLFKNAPQDESVTLQLLGKKFLKG